MKLEYTHRYTIEEATDRIRALTEYWSTRHGIRVDWNGNAASFGGKAKGVSFSGNVAIEANIIRAEVKVGFLAEKLGGRAYVEGKMKDYLDPANTIDELRARLTG